MNERIERAMNSENLGAGITENGNLDHRILALEACRGKMVFSGGFGLILGFLEWLEGFGAKDRGSCGVWEFARDFCGFWRV
jgi:hypothetical protein